MSQNKSSQSQKLRSKIILEWNSKSKIKNSFSLTNMVEENDKIIKETYLNIIESICKKKVNGETVEDCFTKENKSILFYMSLVYEKNLYKSSHIQDCLKIIALYLFLKKNKRRLITIKDVPKNSVRSVRNLMISYRVKYQIFESRKTNKHFIRSFFGIIKSIIPLYLRAIYTLTTYYIQSFKYKKFVQGKIFKTKRQILIISYFLNFNKTKFKKGEFESDYWGELPKLIKEYKYNINWLHMHTSNVVEENLLEHGLKKIRKKKNYESHFFLESFFTFDIFLTCLKQFFFFSRSLRFLSNKEHIFLFENGAIDFWELLGKDWKNSISGPFAIKNIIYNELFNKVLSFLPKQSLYLYLHEGQSWEKIFLKNQKSISPNSSIGVIQSPVRYWDLKLFDKEDQKKINKSNRLPFPDYLAVNTYNGFKMLLNINIPRKKINKVEPLRFKEIYFSKKIIKKNLKDKKRILILGGFLEGLTDDLLRSINLINKKHNHNLYKFDFKFHPGYLPRQNKIEKLNCLPEDIKLDSIIRSYDAAIIAGDSSVSIDTFSKGCKTIVFMSSGEINFNPLRENNFVEFVSDYKSIEKVLNSFNNKKRINLKTNQINKKTKIYFENDNYKMWKRFLNKFKDK